MSTGNEIVIDLPARGVVVDGEDGGVEAVGEGAGDFAAGVDGPVGEGFEAGEQGGGGHAGL